jgi:hypothetical protein
VPNPPPPPARDAPAGAGSAARYDPAKAITPSTVLATTPIYARVGLALRLVDTFFYPGAARYDPAKAITPRRGRR